MFNPFSRGSVDWVVQFSGGISSWAAALLTKRFLVSPGDTFHLLFADTLIEDEDTYAFIDMAAENLKTPVTRIADGRTPWEVFKDVRFLANARIDPCSKILKRELLNTYIEDNYVNPSRVIGIGWDEIHRLDRLRERSDHAWVAPLAEPLKEIPRRFQTPDKLTTLKWAENEGLPQQRLYKLGFPHANCGGGCVKAGIKHFQHLYKVMPDRFQEWERGEQEVREFLDKDVAILRSRKGGTSRPLSLRELRQDLEQDKELTSEEELDWGGCGCAIE